MSAVESTDQERRITFLLYDCWDELAGETTLPALKNMRKEDIEPFKKNLVLLDLREDETKPILQVIGQNLQDDLDGDLTGKPQSEIPRRSMLSRVTDHYLEVLANRVPIAFEAEFVNRDGEKALYRGILLPFSDDNKKINFILGGVRWILEKDVQIDENQPSIEELMRNIAAGKDSVTDEEHNFEAAQNKSEETSKKSRYANDDDIETFDEDSLSLNDDEETSALDTTIEESNFHQKNEDFIEGNLELDENADIFDEGNTEDELILSAEDELEEDELVITSDDGVNDSIEMVDEENNEDEVALKDVATDRDELANVIEPKDNSFDEEEISEFDETIVENDLSQNDEALIEDIIEDGEADIFDEGNTEDELILSAEDELEEDELAFISVDDDESDHIEAVNKESLTPEYNLEEDEEIDDILETSNDHSKDNEELVLEQNDNHDDFVTKQNKDSQASVENDYVTDHISEEENEIKEDFFASYDEDMDADEFILDADSDDAPQMDYQDENIENNDQISLNIDNVPATFADEMDRVLSDNISYEATSLENSISSDITDQNDQIAGHIDLDDILELSEADIIEDDDFDENEAELVFEERSARELQIDDTIESNPIPEIESENEPAIPLEMAHEDPDNEISLGEPDFIPSKAVTVKEFLPEQDDFEREFDAENLVSENDKLALTVEETETVDQSASEADEEEYINQDEEFNEDNLTLAQLMEQVIEKHGFRNEKNISSDENDGVKDDIDETVISKTHETPLEESTAETPEANIVTAREEIQAEEEPKKRKSLIERAAERTLQKQLSAITSPQFQTAAILSENNLAVEDNVTEASSTAEVGTISAVDLDQKDDIVKDELDESNERTITELRATLKNIIGYIKREDANHNRSRDSLYNILAAIYGFYYICEDSAEAYNQLAQEYNLKVQQRAPFTPVLKMCLGNDYDKTRLTEYAATLTLARHLEIEEEDFQEFIRNFPGGIKGCVKELREIRKKGTLNTAVPRKNQALKEAKETLSQMQPIGSFRLKKIIVGDNDKDFCLLLAKRNGHTVDILKILDDKYTKLDPIIKRAAFIKGNGNGRK